MKMVKVHPVLHQWELQVKEAWEKKWVWHLNSLKHLKNNPIQHHKDYREEWEVEANGWCRHHKSEIGRDNLHLNHHINNQVILLKMSTMALLLIQLQPNFQWIQKILTVQPISATLNTMLLKPGKKDKA